MPLGRTFRLMILGGSGVGKTALIEQLIFGNHVIGINEAKTVGDIYEAIIETEIGNEESVHIYDTPGGLFSTELTRENFEQDHYLSIGDGAVLVYDIASKNTFELIKVLRQRIAVRHKEFPMVVIGNKYDLDGIRQVTLESALEWAKLDGVHLYEASVLDRDSLREPFSYIVWSMANPGRTPPAQFQSSFGHASLRKSFTIPQARIRHRQLHDEPLLSPTAKKEDTPPPFKMSHQNLPRQDGFVGGSPESHASNLGSPYLTQKSISSAVSEYSFDSRISSHIYPDDALYPRGGLLGLADCMSTRSSKEKRLK